MTSDPDLKTSAPAPGDVADDAVSRRRWLGGAAIALGAGATFLVPLRAAAQQKAAQTAVKYQTMPNGASKCGICMQFEAPNACKLVAGTINPDGWCLLFTPKPHS